MLNKAKIASIMQKELATPPDNKEAHRVAGVLWSEVSTHVREKKKEWEKVTEDEAESIPMTREELIKYLAKSVKGGNTQAGKLLSELEGFEKASQDISYQIVSFADAPDYFHKSKPPEGA